VPQIVARQVDQSCARRVTQQALPSSVRQRLSELVDEQSLVGAWELPQVSRERVYDDLPDGHLPPRRLGLERRDPARLESLTLDGVT
jgi:hypothetical protein